MFVMKGQFHDRHSNELSLETRIFLRTLAEVTMGIRALIATLTKSAMPQKGQFFFRDPLSSQDSGENEIQDRNPVV
jgi:hypothetical protein